MEREVFVWLALLIIFLVVEIITTGLASIWLAGGSLVALLLSLVGLNLGWQIGGFFITSFVLIYFTRPFAMKYINANREKTNYESNIGKIAKVTEVVDNQQQTGHAVLDGMEWTARAEQDDEVFVPDSLVEVVRISGVKLIVKKHENEED